MVVAHHQLRIDEDVPAKHQRNDDAVTKLDVLGGGKESGHEPEDDDDPKRAEKVGDPRGEVVLGLRGIEGEEDEDGKGEYEGLQDDARGVE